MGLHDGVSKLWILRTDRGALDVDGCKDEVEAIDHLIRHAITWNRLGARSIGVDELKMRVRAAVEDALKHGEEEPDPCSGSEDEA